MSSTWMVLGLAGARREAAGDGPTRAGAPTLLGSAFGSPLSPEMSPLSAKGVQATCHQLQLPLQSRHLISLLFSSKSLQWKAPLAKAPRASLSRN